MPMLLNNASCKEDCCGRPAVISFAARDFCLEHFQAQCYLRLDSLEPLIRRPLLEPARIPKVRALLEECANRTLHVCLRHEPLTNLDRSRLLEILLHCGELQFTLRNNAFPQEVDTRPPFRESEGLFTSAMETGNDLPRLSGR